MALQKDYFAFLDKEHSYASPSYNRWFVPPAALAVHLSIGMAYGFSVFWLPLSEEMGVKCKNAYDELFTNKCDWQISTLVYTYSLFFFFLGLSAATWGKWLEKAGPRKAGCVASILWPLGLVLGAIGIYIHQIFLLWIGSGVIGGIGLGIGYISPVSTLIKWFPDKRGLATGMAIMGFGGGAILGAPLATVLMKAFADKPVSGIPHTLFVMAAMYFCLMMTGSLAYRVPPPGWQPASMGLPQSAAPAADPKYSFKSTLAKGHVHVDRVHHLPQFWLLWSMVLLNVMAGVGLVGMASVMLQEEFGGRLIGLPDKHFNDLTAKEKKQTAAIGAGFVGFISLFNIFGRFGWGVVSDFIGRKNTFTIFFTVGTVVYALIPKFGQDGSLALFTMAFCVVVSFYGGNFAALPAYLADLFGTQFVGAIHGRMLTTWMIGGVVGPQLETYIRDGQVKKGVAPERAYDLTMYLLSSFLAVGLVCNLLLGPIDEKYFMSEKELEAVRSGKPLEAVARPVEDEAIVIKSPRAVAVEITASPRKRTSPRKPDIPVATPTAASVKDEEYSFEAAPAKSFSYKVFEGITLVLWWSAVGVPFAWGLSQTLEKAMKLFH